MREFMEVAVPVGLAVGMVLFFGAIIGYGRAEGVERAAAVKAGVAQHACDPATGKTTFVYLKPEAR